jgi:transposase-like protein
VGEHEKAVDRGGGELDPRLPCRHASENALDVRHQPVQECSPDAVDLAQVRCRVSALRDELIHTLRALDPLDEDISQPIEGLVEPCSRVCREFNVARCWVRTAQTRQGGQDAGRASQLIRNRSVLVRLEPNFKDCQSVGDLGDELRSLRIRIRSRCRSGLVERTCTSQLRNPFDRVEVVGLSCQMAVSYES